MTVLVVHNPAVGTQCADSSIKDDEELDVGCPIVVTRSHKSQAQKQARFQY
jgi:hypothetical protein